MKEPVQSEVFSLLWPDELTRHEDSWPGAINPYFTADLNLEELAEALTFDRLHRMTVGKLLKMLTRKPEIIDYRLDIITDLLANPRLAAALESIMPMLDQLEESVAVKVRDYVVDSPFLQTVYRLGELEVYVDCINQLQTCLQPAVLKSTGLLKLKGVIHQVAGNPEFTSLADALPKLRSGFTQMSSITIGINLNSQLLPYQATILSINEQKFKGGSLLTRFFNKKSSDSPYEGISPLLKIDMTKVWGNDGFESIPNPFQAAIFSEINQIVGSSVKPVAAELDRYTKFNSRLLVTLKSDIAFYLGVLKFITTIRDAGLPLCRPVIMSQDARAFKISDLYNINMAFQRCRTQPDSTRAVVTNDVNFENGHIFILTGPNGGGKTTYTQAIGLAQLIAQLGILVPGKEGALSPVDAIYTHFPVNEKPDSNVGRLGEESQRLNEIFQRATQYSLILLNESLSSTSPGECLYLAQEIVIGLKLLGARTVFATHLHELAANLETINSQMPGNSKVISMVAGVGSKDASPAETGGFNQRTFKITPAPPQGISYARDIAARYGISREKLLSVMRERAVIDPDVRIEFEVMT
jgi:hypothetical protein